MDSSQFDAFSRSVAAGHSRRSLTRLLVGLTLGGPLALLGAVETGAKKKGKKRRRKKRPGVPPAACVPESQLTTCGGLCITKVNNCGQIVECPCLGLQQCLSNGSCAAACVAQEDCLAAVPCGCSSPSVEGPRYCIGNVDKCEQMPQSCTSTAQCPQGQFCITVATACGTNRCIPLGCH